MFLPPIVLLVLVTVKPMVVLIYSAVGGGISATFAFAGTPTISTIAMTSCIVSPSTGTSGLTGCAVTTGGSLTVTGGNFSE